jgi:hypothetical protein
MQDTYRALSVPSLTARRSYPAHRASRSGVNALAYCPDAPRSFGERSAPAYPAYLKQLPVSILLFWEMDFAIFAAQETLPGSLGSGAG